MGIDCPGCGMQRSFIELLKGNIVECMQLYPALLPMIAMFTFLLMHLSFRFKHGAAILKFMFIGVWVIVIVGYVMKLMSK